MYYYALIDLSKYNVCYDVIESETPITDDPSCIQIDSYDKSLIYRKKYVNGAWVNTLPSEAQNMSAREIGVGEEWLDDKIYGMVDDIANHSHDNYSLNTHTHTAGDVGAASSAHNHDTRYYTESEIDTKLTGKANSSHSHTKSQITDFTHTHDERYYTETEIDGKVSTLNTAISGKAASSHTHSNATTSAPGLMSASDKSKLDGISAGANTYTLPTATSSVLGGVKTGSNITNSSGTISLTKANVTAALGYTPPTTNTTYSAATTSAPGLMSAADKSKLDGIATGANKVTIDSALSSSSTNPVQNKIINNALAGKAASSHNHALSAITGLLGLLATADDGDVKVTWSDQDVIAKIKALGSGMHTAYAKGGTTNNPKSTESWRFIVHKTGTTNYGWVIAFGSSGSIYTGYVDNASWKGWKCLYNATSNDMILWSGNAYMQSTNSTPQVVTPSKKLSQCRTGWLLLWSDYDPGSGSNDSDFCTTFIPKYTPSGGTWGGKAFYCDLPIYVGGDANDLSTEKRCIKPIYVHDNCLKGSYQNTSGGRNDVVLRAVYEV